MKRIIILLMLSACAKEKSAPPSCELIREIGVERKDSTETYYIYTDATRYEVSKAYALSIKQGDYYCK